MEPHWRLCGCFVSAIGVQEDDDVQITSSGHNRCEIQWCVHELCINLRLLHGQVMARAVAVILARSVRMIARVSVMMVAINITWLITQRIVAAGFRMRMMPAATDRCMDQQRCGNQAGEQSTHENSIRVR
jgi:hypothetical protein